MRFREFETSDTISAMSFRPFTPNRPVIED